ncbi:hypothetical protein V8D89_013676, partial [Ganoderma adspersum]
NETVTLELASAGRLITKCQVTDYMLRGPELDDYSLFTFVRNTYEQQIRADDRLRGSGEAATQDDGQRRQGRPKNKRSQYLYRHPNSQTKHRIVRSAHHNTLVNIIGRWLPRRDDDDTHDLYCAAMLMLLKPWRELSSDLRPEGLSWREAFERFEVSASASVRITLSGAQYFYECASAADRDRRQQAAGPGEREDQAMVDRNTDGMDVDVDGDWEHDHDNDGVDDVDNMEMDYSEAGLEALKGMRTSLAERLYAHGALVAARAAGYFPDMRLQTWEVCEQEGSTSAGVNGIDELQRWKEQMEADVRDKALAEDEGMDGAEGDDHDEGEPSVSVLSNRKRRDAPASVRYEEDASGERPLDPVEVNDLRPAQFRAYDILVWHLERTLQGDKDVAPLRMIIHGEGGTGKSRVIQTVTEAFKKHRSAFLLVKAAYTGIAASLIDGKTTHVIARIKVGRRGQNTKLTDEAKRILQVFWSKKRYLILDEYSMLAKTFLTELSRNIATGMEGSGLDSNAPFGGINVVLCGDLHQFPPVACSGREALYEPADPSRDTLEQAVGRRLYETFDKVVILDEQMRVTDPEWSTFLKSLRVGDVTSEQVEMLRGLVISDGSRDEMSQKAWTNASLVTPRHAVRKDWNDDALRRFCAEKHRRIFVVVADDSIDGNPLKLPEKYAVVGKTNSESRRSKKDLAEELELAIGMKVMVTRNLNTDLDVANGARGEIVKIVLHPQEAPIGEGAVVKLRFLPAYILVKLDRTKACALRGLDEGVLPVEPVTSSMRIEVMDKGKRKQRTVRQRQFPITAAYGFTDYRSQGQTIPMVMVDIKKPPPPGQLNLFHLYVALSRSHGRDSIRIVREFDTELLMQKHDPALLEEDERLEKLNAETRIWWELLGRGRRRQDSSGTNGRQLVD